MAERARTEESRSGRLSPQRAEPAVEPAARLLRLQAAAGNRAVSRMIAARRRVLARRPVAMTQPGYATGDQFAIAAALIDDRELHVYISTVPPGRDARDKAADIRQFYLDSGVADARIHLVATEQLNDYDALTAAARARRPDFFRIFGVGHGTDYVAKRFSAGMRDRIRAAWGVDDSRDAEIRTWLSGKGLATPAADARAGTRVLVIWSRFSGKKGDIHIEHDTSFQGVRQIIDMAKDDYTAIIIAGDKSWGDRHVAKYGQIAKAVNDTLAAPKVFDLTGFWKDGTPSFRPGAGTPGSGSSSSTTTCSGTSARSSTSASAAATSRRWRCWATRSATWRSRAARAPNGWRNGTAGTPPAARRWAGWPRGTSACRFPARPRDPGNTRSRSTSAGRAGRPGSRMPPRSRAPSAKTRSTTAAASTHPTST